MPAWPIVRAVQHTWIRAFGSCTGASAALTAGGVCAVLVVMGAMTFGLWRPGDGPHGETITLPRVPPAGPASGAEVRGVRAAVAAARRTARSTVVSRPVPARRFDSTVVTRRRAARRPATRTTPPVTSGSSLERQPSSPAAARATGAPQPAVSLPPVGRDAPPTVRRTTEAVLEPVERVADAAQGAVREVAGPTVAPLADAVATPVRGAVGEVAPAAGGTVDRVAGGLLGARAPAPSGARAAP